MSTVVARFELDKLRTVRAPWVVLGAGGAASVLFAAFLAFVLPRFADEAAPSPRELLVLVARTNAAMPVAVAVAVVGALTSELRAGFMLHSLLRARGAWPLWRAKTLVAALLATGCALACTVLAGVLVVLLAGPVPVQVWLSVAVGSALQAVCWALIGLGVAALARRASVALAVVLVVPFVVEPAVRAAALAAGATPVADLLPFAAAAALSRGWTSVGADQFVGEGGLALQLLALLVVVAASCAGGGWSLARRDLPTGD